MVTIHLYHTNDLHSHFESWNPIAGFMQQEKERHRVSGSPVFILDIGDHVDRYHTISEATAGRGNVELLNEAGYDFVTIGNNEGITLPKEELERLYTKAEFPVLVANLFHQDGTRPHWVRPYHIEETAGLTIAFIGVTVAYPDFYAKLGWSITDPIIALEKCLQEVRQKADVVVLLSHLGRNEDEYIATHYDIDVILGAHTHHFFEKGMLVNDTLLCCTGKWGQYVGHVQLEIDVESKEILQKRASTLSVNQLGGYHADTRLDVLQEQSRLILQEKVTVLPHALPVDWFAETEFTSLLASSLKKWCDAEIGMVNAGVLLESLPAGTVTKGDIHRICPHPINPCRLLITGKTLRDVIIKAIRPQTEQMEIKGLGFRGKIMGKMIFDGVQIIRDNIPGNKKLLEEILVNGEPLDLQRMYAVGTIDMFTFGYIYPELALAPEKRYYMPELLRDVLEDTLVRSSVNS
ncbi:bifunctional UDP-sugar hydrolase/5'-nucleotidase [Ectobacillus antri]|uniref:Bifunctional UDP-sugar hydrolase/5'-nucleotidase n=1 Tax=Ectobacillus antri TaxID=2486280 RepID=A0ABT6H886_9BACI|nr:bifunctional UDP-sugar hydrolase/5'-nucleotidase [Ectobacillus antri]MDG4657092.1 bifunctional UDP-sugar hydrolase/5'-nucleotidase [Ectobacillus antri]MDG5754551.1 bifunctional UDP-sugar hydrolase/5'-nucleotidase [Ectobacillus antri]